MEAGTGKREAGEAQSTMISALHRFSRVAAMVRSTHPALRRYALMTLVTSIGTGMYTTVAIVYFVEWLRLNAGFVGAGLTIAAASGLTMALPAGRLADRHGSKRVLIGLYIIQAVLFALFPLVRGSAEFLIAVVFVAIAGNAAYPVSHALLADLVPDGERVAAAAYNRAVLNVGMSLGALIAAGALASSSRSAYDAILLGNALSFVGAAAVLARIKVSVNKQRASSSDQVMSAPERHPLRQARFVVAGVISGILFLSSSILDVALPLQVAQHTNAPRWMIAALLLLNTVLVVALQVRASAGSETVPGAARANRLAGIALLGACLLFSATSGHVEAVTVVVLIAATVFLTAGELFSSAGTWGLSYGLAPPDQQGKYLASFGLLTQMIAIIGPILAAMVVSIGLIGWLAVGAAFVGAGLAAPLVTRPTRETAPEPTV